MSTSLAFSGKATLKATVNQNIILTKRAGEEPLELVKIICGFVSFSFLFYCERIFFFFLGGLYSPSDMKKTFSF